MPPMFVKLQRKGQMVIPRSLRDEVGVSEGTLMKVAVIEGGQFLLTPQIQIDRALVMHAPRARKQALRELAKVVEELRQESKEKGLDDMPMSEINRAVAAARRDMRKTKKTATK